MTDVAKHGDPRDRGFEDWAQELRRALESWGVHDDGPWDAVCEVTERVLDWLRQARSNAEHVAEGYLYHLRAAERARDAARAKLERLAEAAKALESVCAPQMRDGALCRAVRDALPLSGEEIARRANPKAPGRFA